MEIMRREPRSIRTSEMTNHSAYARLFAWERNPWDTQLRSGSGERIKQFAKSSIHTFFSLKSVFPQISSLRESTLLMAHTARATSPPRIARFSPRVDVIVNHSAACLAGEQFGLRHVGRNRRNVTVGFGYPSIEEHGEQRAAGSEREAALRASRRAALDSAERAVSQLLRFVPTNAHAERTRTRESTYCGIP